MGDMADYALQQMMDIDEESMFGDIDEETGERPVSPFVNEYKPIHKGPGLCPRCGLSTVLKTGKFGKFYGCIDFPKCKGNRYI